MNETNLSVQGGDTPKATYEKPTMQLYEMEVEGAILQASGYDTENGGAWGND